MPTKPYHPRPYRKQVLTIEANSSDWQMIATRYRMTYDYGHYARWFGLSARLDNGRVTYWIEIPSSPCGAIFKPTVYIGKTWSRRKPWNRKHEFQYVSKRKYPLPIKYFLRDVEKANFRGYLTIWVSPYKKICRVNIPTTVEYLEKICKQKGFDSTSSPIQLDTNEWGNTQVYYSISSKDIFLVAEAWNYWAAQNNLPLAVIRDSLKVSLPLKAVIVLKEYFGVVHLRATERSTGAFNSMVCQDKLFRLLKKLASSYEVSVNNPEGLPKDDFGFKYLKKLMTGYIPLIRNNQSLESHITFCYIWGPYTHGWQIDLDLTAHLPNNDCELEAALELLKKADVDQVEVTMNNHKS
ncbi:MAG: hypothetical protein WC805_00885 [Patescibacteria group bacterium]|jgi:hypothetical protein